MAQPQACTVLHPTVEEFKKVGGVGNVQPLMQQKEGSATATVIAFTLSSSIQFTAMHL